VSKVVAIDFGTKRIGLAISDSSKSIAFALETVSNNNIFNFLDNLLKNEKVVTFVIGNPVNLQNIENSIVAEISFFKKKLKNRFPKIDIVEIDERFTSVIAKQTIVNSGISKSKRRNKSLVDKISATIILQDFLEKLS
tara:strand:+ start:495 stop:908 length:414 start_codon:yes stop_codon:yes gene_type:complete